MYEDMITSCTCTCMCVCVMSVSEMCLPYQIIHHNHDLASHTLMCQALPPLIVGVKGDMYNITHGLSDNESVVQSCQRMSTGTLGLPQDPHDAWQKVHMDSPRLTHCPIVHTSCYPTCLSHPTVPMGTRGIPTDSHGLTHCLISQWISLWESHVYPLVQWDGTDRWDSS